MKAARHATQVRCPEEHPFRIVEIRWESDGRLAIICKSGTGPVDVHTVGTGNYRQARLEISRREVGSSSRHQ